MVVSERKLLANRMNSQKARLKCTGPRDTSLTRFNATRHGLSSSLPIILPGEDEEVFEKLTIGIRDKLCPQNEIEEEIAIKIAHCIWKLRRGRTAELAIIGKYTRIEGIQWDDLLKSGYLQRIARYERRIMNQLQKLLIRIDR